MSDFYKKDLARIHIMKDQLALDDETYRDMLKGITGKTSSKDMDSKERYQVICEMEKALGKSKDIPKPKTYPGRPAKQGPEKEPMIGKIEALLTVDKLPWKYAHAMAKRMFKVSLVEWCNPDQLWRIIAAMEKNRARQLKRAGHG